MTSIKGTLHSKLTLGFFSWPKSIHYFDLSLTSCTFVKLELREQETNLYSDAGEFDERFGINLEIRNQWLYHITGDKARLGSDSGVHSYGIAGTKSVNKIKLNVSKDMYHNYLDYHTSVW